MVARALLILERKMDETWSIFDQFVFNLGSKKVQGRPVL